MKMKQLTIVLLAGLAIAACAQESADETPGSAANAAVRTSRKRPSIAASLALVDEGNRVMLDGSMIAILPYMTASPEISALQLKFARPCTKKLKSRSRGDSAAH